MRLLGPVAVLMLLAVGAANAQDSRQPIVRAEIKPQIVTVGQPVRLRVTVLVPTWFTSPPGFPSFR